MPYEKRIVCLANSRKISGRCVAGKVVDGRRYGEWVRPISARPTGEVSEEERRYENGGDPKLLDVIDIPMERPLPEGYQQENHVINAEYYWERVGRVAWDDLTAALDNPAGGLWVNGYSTLAGLNDRIPEALAKAISSSLVLIQPQDLVVWVGAPGAAFNNPKRRVRAGFRYGSSQYNLAVTDPVIEREYLAKNNGEYPIATAYLCVSLGESHDNYAYKLVAAVITPERTAAGV